MGIGADLRAQLIGWTAPLTVSHHRGLDLADGPLPPVVIRSVPTRHGSVRCRVQLPRTAQDAPVVLHLHGGGFLMRYPQMDDFWTRFVADRCDAAVINVDYTAAPRARYPVAHEQVHDVAAWITEHADDWGLDRRRVAVTGFSAGGNLAASACLFLRDQGLQRPRLLVLGVPSLDVTTTDKPATASRPMVSPALLRLVRATYFRDDSRRGEAHASPGLAPRLDGLPPTVVLTAQHDALRREGDRFAARLAAAGLLRAHHVEARRDHYVLQGGTHEAAIRMEWMTDHLTAALDVPA